MTEYPPVIHELIANGVIQVFLAALEEEPSSQSEYQQAGMMFLSAVSLITEGQILLMESRAVGNIVRSLGKVSAVYLNHEILTIISEQLLEIINRVP